MDSQYCPSKEKEWLASYLCGFLRFQLCLPQGWFHTTYDDNHDWFHNRTRSFVLYVLQSRIQSNSNGARRSRGHNFSHTQRHLLLQGNALRFEKCKGYIPKGDANHLWGYVTQNHGVLCRRSSDQVKKEVRPPEWFSINVREITKLSTQNEPSVVCIRRHF